MIKYMLLERVTRTAVKRTVFDSLPELLKNFPGTEGGFILASDENDKFSEETLFKVERRLLSGTDSVIRVEALCPLSILAILHDENEEHNSLTEEEKKELESQLLVLCKTDTAEFEERFIPQRFKLPGGMEDV